MGAAEAEAAGPDAGRGPAVSDAGRDPAALDVVQDPAVSDVGRDRVLDAVWAPAWALELDVVSVQESDAVLAGAPDGRLRPFPAD